MNLFSILASSTVPAWVSASFPIIRYILLGYIGLAAIAIIILVLLQPSNSQGGIQGVTTNTETYYAQNKGESREGRMKKATMWLGISIAIATVLFFVTMLVYTG